MHVTVAVSIDTLSCRHHNSHNVSAQQLTDGYIWSGSVTSVGVPRDCDDPGRPWLISAGQGQRINVTLVNFTPLEPRRQLTDDTHTDTLHYQLHQRRQY